MARHCTEHRAISSAVAAAPTASTAARCHPVRVPDAPLEHPHPAHRPTDHAGPPVDAQVVGEQHLGGHLVADGRGAGTASPTGCRRGTVDDGPVVPWQPPSTLGQTTNQRSVSMAAPGPISGSHHPGVGWPGPAGPAAWESPVSAWRTSTAFDRVASRVPHVS